MSEVFLDDLHPDGLCPKCDGEWLNLPKYVEPESHYQNYDIPGDHDWHTPEYLRWHCRQCGYAVDTETLEQARAKR